MASLRVGRIYKHSAFYLDRTTGLLKPKFLAVLAHTPGGDIVARLLTSRPHGRPEKPPCFQGDPYPGYFLGVLGDPLPVKSWLDLRHLDDLDPYAIEGDSKKGLLIEVTTLPEGVLRPLLECAASANDTTRLQERAIRHTLAG